MKESLHNVPAATSPRGERRVINDIDAMRALAHPQRVAILSYLLSGPARTATECAAEVGGSASACSYHLRELERFGLVERAEASDDGRTRPWRAAAVGYSIGESIDAPPAARAAGLALSRAELAENRRLIERFLAAGESLDDAWRSASDFHTFELMVSPSELVELNEKVAALLRDYRAPTRAETPEDARSVRVVYQAFPRIPAAS